MNHNDGKVAQYQRAVTPTIEGSNHSGSTVRGKVLSYGNGGSAPVRNRMGGSLLSNSAASNPVGGLGNSYSLLRSNISPAGGNTVISPRAGSFSDGIAVTGKSSVAPYTGAYRGNGANSQQTAPNNGIAAAGATGQESLTPLSVLPRYDLEPLSEEIPSDGIIFAKIRNVPDSLVVFRTPEERLRNPERLNLDRRQLIKCPILEQEQRLRLLNYQNNQIQVIENLENLPNLIFLDFYNNRLTSLSGPLPSVRGLRVLMAGKNKISAISNLQHLKKLDVLDLHSNDISVIDNLEELHELRVLNLAGNKISIVSKLSSLSSLTELNLRRNQITSVSGLDQLPALQRIFLSHNQLATFDDAACVFQVKHLIELSLDGNPLTEDPQPLTSDLSSTDTTNNSEAHQRYRQQVIMKIATLKHLDLKRVTDDEREAANSLLKSLSVADLPTIEEDLPGGSSGVGGLVDTTAGGDFDLSSLKKLSLLDNERTVPHLNTSTLANNVARIDSISKDTEDIISTSVPNTSRGKVSEEIPSSGEKEKTTTEVPGTSSGSSGSVGNGITLLAKKGQLPKGMSHIDIEVLSSSIAYHQNLSIPGGKALVCVGDAWDWSHLLLAASSSSSSSIGSSLNNNMNSNGNMSSVPATVKRLLNSVTEVVLVHASRDVSLHRLFSNSATFLMQSFPQLQSISIIHGPDIVRVADLDPIIALFQHVETIRHMALAGDQTPLFATSNNGQEDTVRSYVIAQIPRLTRFNDRDVTDSERQTAAQRWAPLLQLRKSAASSQQASNSTASSTSTTTTNVIMSPTAGASKRNSLGGLASAVGSRMGYPASNISSINTTAAAGSNNPQQNGSVLTSPKSKTAPRNSGSVFLASSSSSKSLNQSSSSTMSFASMVQQLQHKQQQLQIQPNSTQSNGTLTARARPQITTTTTTGDPSKQTNTSSFLDRDSFNQEMDQEIRLSVIQALRALQQQHAHLYGPPATAVQINHAFLNNKF